MPYFHVIAVFEARGFALEETDRAAAALFKTLRHQRVRYYEHDTTGGLGPYGPSSALYFAVTADFDVEAPNEERANEITEEVLDALATDEIQYLAHGVTSGEQRVRPEKRAEREPEREISPESEAAEEQGAKRRRPRRRGRGRGVEPEMEEAAEETFQEPLTGIPGEEAAAEHPGPVRPSLQEEETEARSAKEMEGREEQPPLAAVEPVVSESVPPAPPPRSSASMRVTLAVTFRASELTQLTNGVWVSDRQELVTLATTESRRRHPELPADVAPEPEFSSLPQGDTLLTLTWHYDVPVPSAAEEAA
jgi:hypothetical protein